MNCKTNIYWTQRKNCVITDVIVRFLWSEWEHFNCVLFALVILWMSFILHITFIYCIKFYCRFYLYFYFFKKCSYFCCGYHWNYFNIQHSLEFHFFGWWDRKKALKHSWRSISLVIKQWYPWNHGQHLNILILTDSNAISLKTIPQLQIPWNCYCYSLKLSFSVYVLGCGCSCCCRRFCAYFWRTKWKPFQNTFPLRGKEICCCWFFHLQILN